MNQKQNNNSETKSTYKSRSTTSSVSRLTLLRSIKSNDIIKNPRTTIVMNKVFIQDKQSPIKIKTLTLTDYTFNQIK